MRHSTPVPRYFIFTLEDGTWVIQRGVDRVQELLTGKEHTFSSLDISFDIEDMELDLLVAQGIIEQYDDSYIWLYDDIHSEINLATSTLERPLGVANYYYVYIDLSSDHIPNIQQQMEHFGLADRYELVEQRGKIMLLDSHQEPFSLLSKVEDAHTLLAPIMLRLGAHSNIQRVRFNAVDLPRIAPDDEPTSENPNLLIQRMKPKIKSRTVVCIDSDPQTHRLVGQVLQELGVDMVSATQGKDSITLIEDTDPSIIIMELLLPDMHGYEIIAYVRNSPELVHIPIIVVSSLASEADQMLAYKVAKVKDYIVKPLQPEVIRRHVWRQLNQYHV